MKLLLVRHPKPDVPKGLCYGATDVPLLPDWQDNAIHLKTYLDGYLSKENIAYFHSPLSRAAQLANFLSDGRSSASDALKELDFGEWENQVWQDIPKASIDLWIDNLIASAPYQGESLQALANRVWSWWHGVKDSDMDTCVVVAHSGVIKVFVSLLCQWPLEQCHRIDVGFNSVTECHIDGDFITLKRLGAGDWVSR